MVFFHQGDRPLQLNRQKWWKEGISTQPNSARQIKSIFLKQGMEVHKGGQITVFCSHQYWAAPPGLQPTCRLCPEQGHLAEVVNGSRCPARASLTKKSLDAWLCLPRQCGSCFSFDPRHLVWARGNSDHPTPVCHPYPGLHPLPQVD